MKKMAIIAGLLNNLEDMIADGNMQIESDSDMQCYIDMAGAKLEQHGYSLQMNGRYKKDQPNNRQASVGAV